MSLDDAMAHVPHMRGQVLDLIGPLCGCIYASTGRSRVGQAEANGACHNLAAVASKLDVRSGLKRRRNDRASSIPHLLTFIRASHRTVQLIDHTWDQLSKEAIYYPGLHEVSDFTCAWRGHAGDTMGVAGWMRTTADIQPDAGWIGWAEASADHGGQPDDFLEAWRRLNPGNMAVRKASALLKEAWYETRLYPYDWEMDRQPILVISWVVSGVAGAFVAEAAWVDPSGRAF